jgi:hypothetical protein
MEKTTTIHNTAISGENLTLSERTSLNIEGIVEIIASNENNIALKLKDTILNINGSNINIVKLDINAGILQANGNFECIKYGKTGNIFKRLFK